MKTILLFVYLMYGVLFAFAQPEVFIKVDSLKSQLAISTVDSERVLILAKLSEAYRGTNADSALLYGHQAFTLATQIHFPKGEINALLSISVVEREMGNLPKALDVALKALQITESMHLNKEEAFTLARIANVYVAAKNYPKALDYFRQAERKLKIVPDPYTSMVVKMLIGDTYEQMNQLDSAMYYAQLVYPDMYQFEIVPPTVFRIMGNVHAKRGNIQQALHNFRQAIIASSNINDHRVASTVSINMASLYKKINEPDSAIFYAKQGLSYGQNLSYTNRILASANLLADLYEPINIKEALRYRKTADSAQNILYGADKVVTLQAITLDERERQRTFEIAKTAYQNKVRQYSLLIGLGLCFILAFILYINARQKQRANRMLQQQKAHIQDTLQQLKSTQSQLIQSEKMASLGELTAGIAHEIQNPLNFVNNFSEVNTELISEMVDEVDKGNTEEVKAIANDIKQNLEKINHHGKRADAIVKGMLQHSRSSSNVKEQTDITEPPPSKKVGWKNRA